MRDLFEKTGSAVIVGDGRERRPALAVSRSYSPCSCGTTWRLRPDVPHARRLPKLPSGPSLALYRADHPTNVRRLDPHNGTLVLLSFGLVALLLAGSPTCPSIAVTQLPSLQERVRLRRRSHSHLCPDPRAGYKFSGPLSVIIPLVLEFGTWEGRRFDLRLLFFARHSEEAKKVTELGRIGA